MKQALRPYGLSLLFLLGFLLLFSFLSTVLYHFSLFSANVFHIFNDVAAYAGMLISGGLFGFLIKKSALPQALLMSVFLMLCSLFLKEAQDSLIHVVCHGALFLVCALIAHMTLIHPDR